MTANKAAMMSTKGWQLYYFKAFQAALDELEATVTQLAAKDPKGYKTYPKQSYWPRCTAP